MERNYKTFMLSDEPKIAGIPITTGLPVFILTGIGLLIGAAFQLFIVGTILSGVMYYQFGGMTLRIILSIIYWSLPYKLTQLIFRSFPDSGNRLFLR